MTDNEMRIAIAEHLGWKRDPRFGDVWTRPGMHIIPECDIHFLEDLNAMAEAVSGLTAGEHVKWCFALEEICGGKAVAFNATARQRAEAFLKTVGKWIEKGKQ